MTQYDEIRLSSVNDEAQRRLARLEQRLTHTRRALIDTMWSSSRPLTIPELLFLNPDVPQSSAYRNMTTLIDAGVVRRVAGNDDHGRFELAEDLSGHHHHFVCAECGTVEDIRPSPRLEQALAESARVAAEERSFEIAEHRFDLIGRCASCRERATTERAR